MPKVFDVSCSPTNSELQHEPDRTGQFRVVCSQGAEMTKHTARQTRTNKGGEGLRLLPGQQLAGRQIINFSPDRQMQTTFTFWALYSSFISSFITAMVADAFYSHQRKHICTKRQRAAFSNLLVACLGCFVFALAMMANWLPTSHSRSWLQVPGSHIAASTFSVVNITTPSDQFEVLCSAQLGMTLHGDL